MCIYYYILKSKMDSSVAFTPTFTRRRCWGEHMNHPFPVSLYDHAHEFPHQHNLYFPTVDLSGNRDSALLRREVVTLKQEVKELQNQVKGLQEQLEQLWYKPPAEVSTPGYKDAANSFENKKLILE